MNAARVQARRCVVWHRGNGIAQALRTALESRGMVVETSGSGHEVLAMGCAAQQRMEPDQGLAGRGLIVVLDGGGGDLDDQARVLEAMERFSPAVLMWVYEEGANPPMRGLVGKGGRVGAVAGDVVAEVADRQRADDRPALRLIGGSQNGAPKNGQRLTASDVLDGDELAALLKPNK